MLSSLYISILFDTPLVPPLPRGPDAGLSSPCLLRSSTQETSYIKIRERKFSTVTLIKTLVLVDGPRFHREAIVVLGINLLELATKMIFKFTFKGKAPNVRG